MNCPKCGGRSDTACYEPGKGRDPECPLWPPKGFDENGYRVLSGRPCPDCGETEDSPTKHRHRYCKKVGGSA